MTAQETLLNPSYNELKFRLCRATAVLLSTSKQKGRYVYTEMEKLYDKRSKLVHTGICKDFSMDDVNSLKEYVRQSLFKVISIGWPKEKLAKHLTEIGYGEGITLGKS